MLAKYEHNVRFYKVIDDLFDVKLYSGNGRQVYCFSNVLSEHIARRNLSYNKQIVPHLWENMRHGLGDRSLIILNDRAQAEVGEAFDYFISLVKSDYPASTVYKYCFRGNYGQRHSGSTTWCESFPAHLQQRYKIMLHCRSYQALILVKRK